jgi:hypothetical protein
LAGFVQICIEKRRRVDETIDLHFYDRISKPRDNPMVPQSRSGYEDDPQLLQEDQEDFDAESQ